MDKGVAFVTFEVWCKYSQEWPAYRIYVDNELLTERDYRWKNPKDVIVERIPLLTIPGPHYLKLENLTPKFSEFEIKNFQVNKRNSVYRLHDCRFVLNPDDLNR